jgi:nucleoside-diphosphate-sugar epimerase
MKILVTGGAGFIGSNLIAIISQAQKKITLKELNI